MGWFSLLPDDVFERVCHARPDLLLVNNGNPLMVPLSGTQNYSNEDLRASMRDLDRRCLNTLCERYSQWLRLLRIILRHYKVREDADLFIQEHIYDVWFC